MDETEGEAGHEDGHRVRDRGGSGRVVATINLTRGIGQDARKRPLFRGRVPGGRIEMEDPARIVRSSVLTRCRVRCG